MYFFYILQLILWFLKSLFFDKKGVLKKLVKCRAGLLYGKSSSKSSGNVYILPISRKTLKNNIVLWKKYYLNIDKGIIRKSINRLTTL
jgi:hypothetical protein